MIVRVLGEGQYDVPEAVIERLNALDGELESAVEAGDEAAFATALGALLDAVRSGGEAHDPATLDESDVILPSADATMAEVRDMLADDGLIPG